MSRDDTAARGYPAAAVRAARSVVRAAGTDLGERGVRVALDGDVADGDDADGLGVLADGHAPDVVLAHDLDRLVERAVRRQRPRVARRDLADLRVGVAAVGDGAHDDVAVGDDAGELVVL